MFLFAEWSNVAKFAETKTFTMNFLLRFFIVLTACCLVSANLVGQEGRLEIENKGTSTASHDHIMSWEQFVERMMGEEWNSDEDGADDDELLQNLYELYLHPLNINEATKEDLLVFPFVNEDKADGIMSYLEHNRPMRSFGELMLIDALSKADREMLRLFLLPPEECSGNDGNVKAPITFSRLLQYSKNELLLRSDIPFYTKDGYRDYPEEVLLAHPNKVYRGDRFHHALRYSFSSMNHLFAGVQMEKDAGERGVDYFSGYVMVKDMGIVKRAIVGDYKIGFGQGLAVNTSMKYGKMMMYNSMDRMDIGIRRHSSTSEAGYFTGAAATIALGEWQISAFCSYRDIDATLRNDTLGVATLKTDGMHRTALARSKKNNLGVSNFGGNVHWGKDAVLLSATFVTTHFTKPLLPVYDTDATLYRLYNAEGQDFQVGSMSYMYRGNRLTISGETAYSHCDKENGVATLNSVRWKADGSNVLTLSGRYYGAKFVSINGRAFGENSLVQNEEGLFLGWMSKSLPNTQIDAYVDAMYFPWMKYRVSGSSYGVEGMVQAVYSASNSWNLLVRYKVKSKQADYTVHNSEAPTLLRYKTNQNLKLQLNNILSPSFSLRTSVSGTMYRFADDDSELGFSVSENVRWENASAKLRIDLMLSYFDTDTYNARVYGYEPSLLYSFGSTSYYYRGMRGVLMANIPMLKQRLLLSAKIGMTRYFNRDEISSGLERIAQNHREDLSLQLRYKF